MGIGLDQLDLNTTPIELLARIQGGAMQQGNPILQLLKRRIAASQPAAQRPSVPAATAARLSALSGMSEQQLPSTDAVMPFPGITGMGGPPPGAHPARGFLDNYALGLAGTQLPPITGGSPFSQFLQSLIGSTAKSWAGQRIAPIQAQADYDQSQREARAAMVKANMEAMTKAAEAESTEAAKAKNEALVPAIDIQTGKEVPPGPDGKKVYVRKSVGEWQKGMFEAITKARNEANKTPPGSLTPEFYATHIQDPNHPGKWLPNKPAGEEMGPNDLTIHANSMVPRYINLGDYPQKQQIMIRKIAKQAGYPVLDDATSKSFEEADKVSSSLDQMLQSAAGFLPKTAAERAYVGPLNEAAALTQSNPDIAAFRTYALSAISLLKGFAGKGSGFRMTQKEIDLATHSMPTISDTYPVAERKVNIIKNLLNAASKRSLPVNIQQPEEWTPKSGVPVQ